MTKLEKFVAGCGISVVLLMFISMLLLIGKHYNASLSLLYASIVNAIVWGGGLVVLSLRQRNS